MKRLYNFRATILLGIYALCLFYSYTARAQSFELDNGRKRETIPFRMVRNMIVVKVIVNNKGPFNFILDTGVGLMIVTDPTIIDSLHIASKRTIKLGGLGQGDDVEAYLTSPVKINIQGLSSHDVSVAILTKDLFSLSNSAGMPIHGLLGYEFFNHLAVKINFSDSTLVVFRPDEIKKFAKGEKIPLSIQGNKPYINTRITLPNGTEKQCKLVMDIGAGHPLLLENLLAVNELPNKFIKANLGQGFNGPINGYISRVPEIVLGKYIIKNILTSFPANHDGKQYNPQIARDGNLGLGLLKRFTMIIDYTDSILYLEPFKSLKVPFEHDMSGLEYYATGDGYKHVIIDRVEPGSAGDLVGLEKNDEIISINFKPVANMSIEDIDEIFKSGDNRSLLLEVFHENKYDNVILTLKRRI